MNSIVSEMPHWSTPTIVGWKMISGTLKQTIKDNYAFMEIQWTIINFSTYIEFYSHTHGPNKKYDIVVYKNCYECQSPHMKIMY